MMCDLMTIGGDFKQDSLQLVPYIDMRLCPWVGSCFNTVYESLKILNKEKSVKRIEYFNEEGWQAFVLKIDALRRELFAALDKIPQETAIYHKRTEAIPWTIQALKVENVPCILVQLGVLLGTGCSKKVYAVWVAPKGNLSSGKLHALIIARKPWQGNGVGPEGNPPSIPYSQIPAIEKERRSEIVLEEKTLLKLAKKGISVLNVYAKVFVETFNLNGSYKNQKVERVELLAPIVYTFEGLFKSSQLSADKIIKLLMDYFTSLQKLHSKGWYHFDLKMDNLFIDVKGQGILGDFGQSWHYKKKMPNFPRLECIRDKGRPDTLIDDWYHTFRTAYDLWYLDKKGELGREDCLQKLGRIDVRQMALVLMELCETNPKLKNLASQMLLEWESRPTINEVIEKFRKYNDTLIIS